VPAVSVSYLFFLYMFRAVIWHLLMLTRTVSISSCLSSPVPYHNVNLFIGVPLKPTLSHPRLSGCPLLFRVCCKKHKLVRLCACELLFTFSYLCVCTSATIRTVLQVFCSGMSTYVYVCMHACAIIYQKLLNTISYCCLWEFYRTYNFYMCE